MRNVTFQQLRTFIAVAKHLSFGKAADELCVTQPAVSMQIRELEQAINMPLFVRTGRKVNITMPGEYFLIYARRIMNNLRDAEAAIERMRNIQHGRMTVGLVSNCNYFIPRLLSSFRVEYPGTELQLIIGNRKMIIDAIERNEVDIAIMGKPPQDLAAKAEPFAPHPVALIASPTHPLVELGNILPGSLQNERFIIREEGSGTRSLMEKFFFENNLRPNNLIEIGNSDAIKQAVAANMGISLLSIHTLKLELQAGMLRILNVKGFPIIRLWHVVYPTNKQLSPTVEALRFYLLENGEDFLEREFSEIFPAGLTNNGELIS